MRSKLIYGNSFSSRHSSMFFCQTCLDYLSVISVISHGVVLLSELPYRNSIAFIPLFTRCVSHDLYSSLEDLWIFHSQLLFQGYKMFLMNHEEYGLFISYAWIMRSWTRKDLPACVRSAFGHFYSDTQYKPVLLWETASHPAPLQTVRRAICVILTCIIGLTWCKMAYCVHQSLFTDETRVVCVGLSTEPN